MAFVIKSAYDKLPQAFRRDEFFFAAAEEAAESGVGGMPITNQKWNLVVTVGMRDSGVNLYEKCLFMNF